MKIQHFISENISIDIIPRKAYPSQIHLYNQQEIAQHHIDTLLKIVLFFIRAPFSKKEASKYLYTLKYTTRKYTKYKVGSLSCMEEEKKKNCITYKNYMKVLNI